MFRRLRWSLTATPGICVVIIASVLVVLAITLREPGPQWKNSGPQWEYFKSWTDPHSTWREFWESEKILPIRMDFPVGSAGYGSYVPPQESGWAVMSRHPRTERQESSRHKYWDASDGYMRFWFHPSHEVKIKHQNRRPYPSFEESGSPNAHTWRGPRVNLETDRLVESYGLDSLSAWSGPMSDMVDTAGSNTYGRYRGRLYKLMRQSYFDSLVWDDERKIDSWFELEQTLIAASGELGWEVFQVDHVDGDAGAANSRYIYHFRRRIK